MHDISSKSYGKKILFRILFITALLPALVFAGWWGYGIYDFSQKRAELKSDYSEVNDIYNGLLSVDIWRDHITEIVSLQIEDFELSGMQQDTLRKEINKILNALITQADQMINEKQKKFKGKVAKFAFKNFVDVDKIRERVPAFSQTIIDEIKKPRSKQRLKFLVKDKLEDFASRTRDSIIVQSDYEKTLAKYNVDNAAVFNAVISQKEAALQEKSYNYMYRILGIMALFLLIWVMVRNVPMLYTPLFILSALLALIVLIIGLVAPMIEIDARIQEINFILIGKNIRFYDQVLFYQSKSIIDVVKILIQTRKVDSVLVGILILVFSVVFPITKLVSTKLYLLGNEKWRRSGVIRFFAFKSGKWSMADVMVVAIFMAYIGFKGILDSQLGTMNMDTSSLTSITTNKTSLQPGFVLFIAFVLFGLILSVILKKIAPRKEKANPKGIVLPLTQKITPNLVAN
jgi:hypothetical protein